MNLFKDRGKLWGYGACTLLFVGATLLQLNHLEQLDAHLSRDRGQLFHYNGQGQITNGYTVKVHNKSQRTQQYTIKPLTSGLSLKKALQLELTAGDKRTLAFEVICLAPCSLTGASSIDVQVVGQDGADEVVLSSRFFAPRT